MLNANTHLIKKSNKKQFTILKDYRFNMEINQKKSYEDPETKNLVINFRSIMKRIISNKKYQLGLQTAQQLINFMQQSTSIEMIRDSLSNFLWFQQLMQYAHKQGYFLKQIIQSSMTVQNKLYCIKFSNKLYNAFYRPQMLVKWKDFKKKTYVRKRLSNTESNFKQIVKSSQRTQNTSQQISPQSNNHLQFTRLIYLVGQEFYEQIHQSQQQIPNVIEGQVADNQQINEDEQGVHYINAPLPGLRFRSNPNEFKK